MEGGLIDPENGPKNDSSSLLYYMDLMKLRIDSQLVTISQSIKFAF